MALRKSIQQAAMSSLAVWLKSQFPEFQIYDRWPESQVSLDKAITILRTGGREDEYIDPQILRQVNLSSTQAVYTWRLAYCSQPVQLDIWTTSDVERDDVMARLDDALHSGSLASGVLTDDPVYNGVKLNFDPADGWQGAVNFRFDTPQLIETPSQVQEYEFRASYSGFAYFELSVDAPSPRMAQINLRKILTEQDPPPSTILPETTIINGSS